VAGDELLFSSKCLDALGQLFRWFDSNGDNGLDYEELSNLVFCKYYL